MTTIEDQLKNDDNFKNWEKNQRRSRICAGILVLGAAVLFFLKEAGYFIPSWVFTWPVLLIAIGIISGIKHKFRHAAWFILITIGGIFLLDDIVPDLSIQKYKIPLILLMIGLILIFKPKNRYKPYAKYQCRNHYHHHKWNIGADNTMNETNEEVIMINNVFAGTKKSIISKNFKGGDIRNVFGGCEINMMQADITSEAIINITQHFGGIKLVVPANWVVKSDVSCVLAGIEDHRQPVTPSSAESKSLLLKGQVVMGGIEIVSY